jgi:hypothetical protein
MVLDVLEFGVGAAKLVLKWQPLALTPSPPSLEGGVSPSPIAKGEGSVTSG